LIVTTNTDFLVYKHQSRPALQHSTKLSQ